jgi:PAS domain S-box-containing protein
MLQAHIADRSVPYDIEHRFVMPNGRYRWFHVVGQSITDDDGRLVRMAGMITDIDSERRTLKALRISEAQIATLLNNSPAPIYFNDKQSRFVMINQRYANVYGIKMENAVGRTSHELFPPDMAKSFSDHDQQVIESRSLIVREEQIGDATFLTAKFPIIDQYRNLLGVGGIETDISKRVSVEMAYREARDEAEAANRSKSAFLANKSHELRTPLNSVIGFSDRLLSGTLGEIENPLYREYLSIVRKAGEHLLDHINDILDLSRIEAGKLELDETNFDIEKVISDAVRLTAERAGSVGLVVSEKIAPDLPLVHADERQIKQIIINLISNAIKFTDPGGQIIIAAALIDSQEIEIYIKDSGVGISAEDLERVQKPFIQVADAMTQQHTRSGLGLSIVRSIIKLHGGTMRLESELGKGTTVFLSLQKRRLKFKKS